MKHKDIDLIVVGAGHAGIEASWSAANLGLKVLVVTTNISRIGYMSCNPSIGGLAKGHMVKEIDILGGIMPLAADRSSIQFKRLNAKKGPAVRGSRAQCDKDVYSRYTSFVLKNHKNISLLEGEVKSLVIEKHRVKGVVTADNEKILSKAVILTTGTFMNAYMFIGNQKLAGGRVGDKSSIGLSDQLKDIGFGVRRLKTGTPPRLSKKSINWDVLDSQYGDINFIPFSFRSKSQPYLPQVACFLSHTNEKTHEIINKNLSSSPLFSGQIVGKGPRYCPSIEDKITRFSEKLSHQTFLEPESLIGDSIYLQGISTSLPENIQLEFLRTIKGLENVNIIRPGYAVEYDFLEPTQISHSLESRNLEGLFLAGQINGTSGYEEAAAQGLVAGINSFLKITNQEPFIVGRDEAYVGVLIDDLVIKGTKEPYRMFTSRAEYRMVLREDNALDRLEKYARKYKLVDDSNLDKYMIYLNKKETSLTYMKKNKIVPNSIGKNITDSLDTTPVNKPTTIAELLRRPEVKINKLSKDLLPFELDENILNALEVEVKYEGYISRQKDQINQFNKYESIKIPQSFDFSTVKGLSSEESEKLAYHRPITLGHASRISGVNPSAIQCLMIRLR